MSAKITRYALTYCNDYQEVYQADRDEAEEGEFVLYEDHACIVADLLAANTALAGELEEWRFTNKVDELQRENDRLRAALAAETAALADALRHIDRLRGERNALAAAMAPQPVAPPAEGILHHALRDQLTKEALDAIEAQQAKRDRRLAAEHSADIERRKGMK